LVLSQRYPIKEREKAIIVQKLGRGTSVVRAGFKEVRYNIAVTPAVMKRHGTKQVSCVDKAIANGGGHSK